MNRQDIKVSVIMACHNSSCYLGQAVSSVLGQTCAALELILVDDCSEDNTLEISKRYQINDDRVSVLSMPINSGPAAARNAGIWAARGKWIGILDSDDIALPSRFEEQTRLADSNDELVMIASNSISIDANGQEIKEHNYPKMHKDLVKRLYSNQAFPPHSSMLYRRTTVEKLSAFNLRYKRSQDYDLWLRLSEVGRFQSIEKPLAKIRKHNHNISNSDGGLLQARLGLTAIVCYFLRLYNYPDPSSTYSGTKWIEFLSWIDMELHSEGFFEKLKTWTEARTEFLNSENRLIGGLQFGARLQQAGILMPMLIEKVFGSSLPKTLAKKWIKKTCDTL